MSTPDLSIVCPTHDRARRLADTLVAIAATTHCAYELVVVDGASTDATAAVLDDASRWLGSRLRVIREPDRGGVVRALDAGLRAARGRVLCWIHDDVRPLPHAFDQLLEQVDRADEQLGLVAPFFERQTIWNVAYEKQVDRRTYRLCHHRGTLYASFPAGRRETFAALGFLDTGFAVAGAEVDLSLRCWEAGLRVEPAYLAAYEHARSDEPRHVADAPAVMADLRRLDAKWSLPAIDGWRNGFDPCNPCTLRRDGVAA